MTTDNILKRELEEITIEVNNQADFVAFVPLRKPITDFEDADQQMHDEFVEKARLNGIGSVLPLKDHDPKDAFVLEGYNGHKSVWVRHNYTRTRKHKNAYKHAYMQFWWQYGGLPKLPWIDGSRFHIDHTFNKARIICAHARDPMIDDESELTDPSMNFNRGYIRLFLLPEHINTEYGFRVEGPLSRDERKVSQFKHASWLILLKMIKYYPPPKSELELPSAVVSLENHFGAFPFDDTRSFEISVGASLGIYKSVNSSVVGGKITTRFGPPNFGIEFSEEAFARALHSLTGWKLVQAVTYQENGARIPFWSGVQMPNTGDLIDVTGYADLDRAKARTSTEGVYFVEDHDYPETIRFDEFLGENMSIQTNMNFLFNSKIDVHHKIVSTIDPTLLFADFDATVAQRQSNPLPPLT